MCIKFLELLLKQKAHWSCAENGGHSASKVEARKPRHGRKGELTDRTVDKLQNYHGITVRANVGNLA